MKKETDSSLTYSALGASADKDGLHQVLDTIGALPDENYFCQLVKQSNLDSSSNYRSFIHSDGAGTKSIISYLWYKETSSNEYFGRLAQDALVMNLDDVYCLGDVEDLVLSNAIARNSRHISDNLIAPIIKSYYELGEKLNSLSVPICISGGETADCGDVVRTLIVDATLFGRIKNDALISPSNIKAGDVIVSLASFGKATYEETYNSGIGSNGLTLARHALLKNEYAIRFPEIKDPELDNSISYQGPFSVIDTIKEMNSMTIGDALSSPTRTYAPVLKEIFSKVNIKDIHGVIHLTGGAHGKVLRFLPNNCRIIKDNLIEAPALFSLIQEHGKIELREMYRVFNMGNRLDIYCPEKIADTIINIAKTFNIEAKKSGHIESSDKKEVILKTSDKEIIYS